MFKGEIDVAEGVHNSVTNQYTLHTSSGCNADPKASMTGKLLGATCASGAGHNSGCGVTDTDSRSYGKGFNQAGGGVYAHIWDATGIKIWHFARADIPADITSKKPNPSSWPEPAAFFPDSKCDTSSFFHDHVLTLNIALCGDWAGSKGGYDKSGCPGTCAEAVTKPENFVST